MGRQPARDSRLAHGVATGDGPAVHVRTTVHDPRSAVASLRMASAGAPHDKSDLLRRRREATVAPSDQIDVLVDFAPVRFEVCNDGDDRWLAAAEHTGYGLIVESRRTTVGRPPRSDLTGLAASAKRILLLGMRQVRWGSFRAGRVGGLFGRPPGCR